MSPGDTELGESGSAKARGVRDMFGSIAGRYDFLNHFLSANIDKRWRRLCVLALERRLQTSDPRILDVGCGTADLAIALAKRGRVVACDFSLPMLSIGDRKVRESRLSERARLAAADALSLPFRADSFDAVASAFVLRNLADLHAGLREMHRVLRPGGALAALDFSMPSTPIFREIYGFYFSQVLPRVGRWISGVEGPYRYLPESVKSFPEPERIALRIADAGFRDVSFRLLTGGIAVVFLAQKRT